MKIHTGDNVKVLAGKDRGKTGKVLQILPKDDRLVVEGINMMKKNVRPRREGGKGQIVEFNAPIHSSNVQLLCPKCSQPARISFAKAGKSKDKNRTCQKCRATF